MPSGSRPYAAASMLRPAAYFLAVLACAALARPAVAAPALVDVAWVAERTCTEGLLVLDVRRSRTDHEVGHIPCAVFTNFYEDGWRETREGIPLRIPPPGRVAALLGRLGVGAEDHVVISAPGTGRYDAAEAAAIFVTLRTVGHARLSILDGGLAAWTAEWENDVDTGYHPRPARTYELRPGPPIVVDRGAVEDAIAARNPLVDLRTSDQYLGINRNETVVRHGTLPGARNVPLSWFLVDGSMIFHRPGTVVAALAHAGVPPVPDPVVFCNAGLESALGWFVLYELLGRDGTRLYDGSLAEWSRDPDLPLHVTVQQR